jgi:hypothetical protein
MSEKKVSQEELWNLVEDLAEELAEAWHNLQGQGHSAGLVSLVLEAYDEIVWGAPEQAA